MKTNIPKIINGYIARCIGLFACMYVMLSVLCIEDELIRRGEKFGFNFLQHIMSTWIVNYCSVLVE